MIGNPKVCSFLQDDTLVGDATSMDMSTEENMMRLVTIAKDLLKKPVSRVNLDTGVSEEVIGEATNEEALTRFAVLLSQERKHRMSASSSS